MTFLLKRFLFTIGLLIGITFLSFVMMQLAPGDPTAFFMDPNSSVEDLARIRANMGLDKPIPIQYLNWLGNLIQGDFGVSFSTGKPVLSMISERLPATLLLSLTTLILVLILTFPLGLISGAKKNSTFDNWVTVLSFIGMSIPTFWLGLILILIFSVNLGLFPTSGFMSPNLHSAPWGIKVMNIVHHLALPLLTSVIGSLAGLIRYFRFGVIAVLDQDYIKAARARGLSERRILFKHAFKNTALPIITILGLQLPGLISGSFVLEYVFSWPGLGQLGIASVFSRDYPILMATLFFSSVLIIVGNLLADIAYAYVDPRVRIN